MSSIFPNQKVSLRHYNRTRRWARFERAHRHGWVKTRGVRRERTRKNFMRRVMELVGL